MIHQPNTHGATSSGGMGNAAARDAPKVHGAVTRADMSYPLFAQRPLSPSPSSQAGLPLTANPSSALAPPAPAPTLLMTSTTTPICRFPGQAAGFPPMGFPPMGVAGGFPPGEFGMQR